MTKPTTNELERDVPRTLADPQQLDLVAYAEVAEIHAKVDQLAAAVADLRFAVGGIAMQNRRLTEAANRESNLITDFAMARLTYALDVTGAPSDRIPAKEVWTAYKALTRRPTGAQLKRRDVIAWVIALGAEMTTRQNADVLQGVRWRGPVTDPGTPTDPGLAVLLQHAHVTGDPADAVAAKTVWRAYLDAHDSDGTEPMQRSTLIGWLESHGAVLVHRHDRQMLQGVRWTPDTDENTDENTREEGAEDAVTG